MTKTMIKKSLRAYISAEIKELFQCLEHYATSPSSLTLMWASHMA